MIEQGLGNPNSGRTAIINGRVVLPDRIVEGQALVIDDGRVAGLSDLGAIGSGTTTVDAGGMWVTPGLVDIHTHGAVHHTFNEPNDVAFGAITWENARRGVTSMVGTLASVVPVRQLCECLDFFRQWMAAPRPGAQLLGAHLESPYIEPLQCGGVNRRGLRFPADGSAEPFLAYGDVLRLFVLAPELPGALELIPRLIERGIRPAAGHSMARDHHLRAAMDRGLNHITHIWSSQSMMVREGPWRKPGLLEATLAFEGLNVEMISDNRHLPPTLMQLAYRCIGPDRLCAISDATNGAGLPEGTQYQIGDMDFEVREGVGMLVGDDTTFAGSSTLLSQMVPILRREVGIPTVQAVRMASLTPANAVGWGDRKGSLEHGKDADVVLFDDEFEASRVMIRGRWIDQEAE